MKIQVRIDKALERARSMAERKKKVACQRRCKGAFGKELLQMFAESILPESVPVVEDIFKQIEEYHQRPPRELANGKMTVDIHGFVEWLRGLRDGWASLPEKMPHGVLVAWRDDYARRRAAGLRYASWGDGFCGSPVPMNRCADCHMVQPNCNPRDESAAWIRPCPVCGSDNFEQMNFHDWGTFHTIKGLS
jgi:hypothetical protein